MDLASSHNCHALESPGTLSRGVGLVLNARALGKHSSSGGPRSASFTPFLPWTRRMAEKKKK